MTPLVLPNRNQSDEDHFLAQMARSTQVESIIDLVTLAVDAKRPGLAARLIGLIDDLIEIPPEGPLAEAKQAARFFLRRGADAKPAAWNQLEDAWRAAHRRYIQRAKDRQRDRLNGHTGRPQTPFGRTRRRR